MFEEMMVRNCAPTLAGIKVGSLFNCKCLCGRDVINVIRNLNKRLLPHGIRVIPMSFSDSATLIYVYRPEKLNSYLSQDEVKKILTDLDYPADDADRCVRTLAGRLCEQDVFPSRDRTLSGIPGRRREGLYGRGSSLEKLTMTA